MSVEVCSPVTRLAAQRPFRRKIGQQMVEIAMQCANQDLPRPRQPNVLPFSANWRCYPGNLGYKALPRVLFAVLFRQLLLYSHSRRGAVEGESQ